MYNKLYLTYALGKLISIKQICDTVTYDLRILRDVDLKVFSNIAEIYKYLLPTSPLYLISKQLNNKKENDHEICKLPLEKDEWEFKLSVSAGCKKYILKLPQDYVIIEGVLSNSDYSVEMNLADKGLNYEFTLVGEKVLDLNLKMILNEDLFKHHTDALSNIKKKTKLLAEIFHYTDKKPKSETNYIFHKVIIKSVGDMYEVSINDRKAKYKKDGFLAVLIKCIIDGPIAEKGDDGKGVGREEYDKLRDRVRYFFNKSKRKNENDIYIKDELKKLIIQSDGSIHLQKNLFNLDIEPQKSCDILEITRISFSFNPDF